MRVASTILAALLLTGCRPAGVVGVDSEWTVTPAALDFGGVYLGAEAGARLTVHNERRAPLELTLDLAAPFGGPATVVVGGGDVAAVPLVVRPVQAGVAAATLHLSDGERAVAVPLTARGLEPLDCGPPSPCHEVHFEPASGACVETPAPDGTACEAACLADATCQQGQCVGAAKRCDDGDACTADTCDSEAGCVHQDLSRACPTSADPCLVAVCAPASGCGVEPALDGTACGPNDCTTARVCVNGRCESRAAPEGSECARAGVCQAPSTCRQRTCVAGPIGYPVERWRHAPAGRDVYFEGTVDAFGTAYFTESPLTDATGALELVAIDRDGRERLRVELARPCLRCGARLMLAPDANLILVGRQGLVEARHLGSGALVWSRDTRAGKTLRSPQPDGGAAWSSAAFIALGPGLVVENLAEGYEVHRQYAVALELATGRVAWERDWLGHVDSPGATTANELWIAAADCWVPVTQVEVLDVRGATSRVLARPARPVSFFEDRALLVSSQLVWASPAGLSAPLPVAPNGASWALTAPGRTVLAGYQSAQQLDDDGGVRWTRGLSGYLNTGALVVDGGTLLSWYGDDGGSTLLGVDGQGATTFECPLPGLSNAGTTSAGLWIASISLVDRDVLVAFEVPAAVPEARGWVTPAGSARNDHRPR